MKRKMILSALLTLTVVTVAMSPKLADGLSGECTLLYAAGGKIFAGGYFDKADRRVVNNIAQYDGTKWSGLSKGVDGTPKDMCIVGKDLYVCGDWVEVDKTDDGGVQSNQIARWDGTKWHALEKLNVDQKINALATDGKNLYIGGKFTKIAGKIDGYNVAKWDGKKWSNLTKDKFENSAGTSAVMSLAWHEGKLYAGGYFQTIGEEPCNKIAVFDGKSWSEVGNKGLDGMVDVLVSDGKMLYAGGEFSTAGDGTTLNYIAKWDGTKWQPIGNGLGKKVSSIAIDGSTIYAAAAGNVYKWDGKSWSELPEIQYASIRAVAVFNGTLYAGGLFDGNQFQGICKFVNGKWEAAYQ
jgi:hypothetical protein